MNSRSRGASGPSRPAVPLGAKLRGRGTYGVFLIGQRGCVWLEMGQPHASELSEPTNRMKRDGQAAF